MSELELLQAYLVVGGLLVAIGLTGFLVRRNLLVMFLSVEIMLQGVSLSLVAWSRYHGDLGGQVFVLMIIAVAACEAGIGLALVLMLARRVHTLDVAAWQDLRESGVPPHVDRRIPEAEVPAERWPKLPVAGVVPEPNEEEEFYRSRV